jgi:hypothetical protein
VGESLATIEKHSMPLEEATTPSLEAWKAFSTLYGQGRQRQTPRAAQISARYVF